jgi:hypothetical protein
MDDEMINNVIKASFNCWNKNRGLSYTVEDLSDSEKEFAKIHSIEVIKALREPSYKMLAKFDGLMIDDWQAMIDAILND